MEELDFWVVLLFFLSVTISLFYSFLHSLKSFLPKSLLLCKPLTPQGDSHGDSHKTTHVLLLDACATRKRTLDQNIVDLVKNKLASQTIFKVSP